MYRPGWKRVVPWLIAAFVLLAAPVHAFAAEGEDFSLGSVPHLFPGGASLGTVADVHGTTDGWNGTGPCTTEAMPAGYPHASVFRLTPDVRALLRVDATDDLGSSASLCRVTVYAATSEFDPFDAGDRAGALVDQTGGCATSSSCAMETWLSAGRTYLLVLWAEPPAGSPAREASFSLDASLREPTSMSMGVAGHRLREGCSGYHEVITGRNVTVTVLSPVNGNVSFVLASTSGATVATYERPLEGGRATLTIQAAPAGRFRMTARIEGTLTRRDGVSEVLLHFLTPRWSRYAEGGIRLHVPWYHQRYRLSCEAATLRMAHNYHDPYSIGSDGQVLRLLGVDRRARRGNRWGDPNRTFVGDPNGRMMKTGYGVHYAPIARVATRYDRCRPAVMLRGASRQTYARYLADGYPIVVWGAHRGPSGIVRVRWRSWWGNIVTAYSVEHTWTIVGFRGSVANPTHFIIHDPSGRGNRTLSIGQFSAFHRYFRTAVVVRG